MMEALLVANYLDSHGESRSVVAAMKHLPEGALTQRVDNLVAESQVVVVDDLIVPTLVVVAVVVCRVVGCRHLFLAAPADVVDRLVVKNFLAFVLG